MPGSLVFNKVAGWPATLLKKGLWHKYFPVNFEKFLRTTLLTEHLRWLILAFQNKNYSTNLTTVKCVLNENNRSIKGIN